MAPVEFEKHIKERLEERRIKPGPDAWKRIANRIGSDSARRKNNYVRYAAAAVIAGILFSALWFYSGVNTTGPEGMPVVGKPEAQPVELAPLKESETHLEIEPQLVLEETETTTGPSLNAEITTEQRAMSIAVQNSETGEQILSEPESDTMIDAKISELIAQVELMEEQQDALTDAEVDSLLRSAQRELLADKQFREGNRVDASSLLAGVEDELDKSFRDQVLEKLKLGFDKVRTAVADRNK